MHKWKKPSGEEICDYCNVRYPDKRSLMIHEFIHVDQDMDTFFSDSGILETSDYLPKATQLLPNGMHNKRFLEIKYRKVVMNNPRCGKRHSKNFLTTEVIDELLYLCKKYPLRESADSICEKLLESDESPIADKVPVLLCSPPIYSELTPVYPSDSDSSSASLSSSESSSDDSESVPQQNKAQIKNSNERGQYGDEPNIEVSQNDLMDQTYTKESLSDSGYGSSPIEHYSKHIEKDSNCPLPESKAGDSYSTIEINELLKNIVSSCAAGSDNHAKSITKRSIDTDEFKPIVESSAHDKFDTQKNMKFDFQASDKQVFQTFVPVDKNLKIEGNLRRQNYVEQVYSMPQIFY